jgi:hypothetical protein
MYSGDAPSHDRTAPPSSAPIPLFPRPYQFTLRKFLVALTASTVLLAFFDWRAWHVGSAAVLIALFLLTIFLPRRPRRALVAILVCTYAPYAWLLADYPWSDYRWGWIGMGPLLPGLLPGAYFFHATNDTLEFATMALCTLLFIALALAIASGRRWLLAATAAVVLLLSLANSWIAYALFRA